MLSLPRETVKIPSNEKIANPLGHVITWFLSIGNVTGKDTTNRVEKQSGMRRPNCPLSQRKSSSAIVNAIIVWFAFSI